MGNISTRYDKEIPIPSPESIAHLLKLADKEVPYHKHILDILAQAEDKSITWLVLGPLSSLTCALEHDPELVKRKLTRVVIMGGTIDEPGNTTAVAEWNIYAVSRVDVISGSKCSILTAASRTGRLRSSCSIQPVAKFANLPEHIGYDNKAYSQMARLYQTNRPRFLEGRFAQCRSLDFLHFSLLQMDEANNGEILRWSHGVA